MIGEEPYSLDAALALAWSLLEEGARDRRSPFHVPTLATVDANGLPQARTVTLREADPLTRHLRFNTDARAPKFAEMQASGTIALHVYDVTRKIQVRVQGLVHLRLEDERAADVWDKTPGMSRECYRMGCAPGAEVDDVDSVPRNALDDAGGQAHFAVADVTVTAIDWLFLRASGHMRAGFDLTTDPAGMRWLAP